MVRKKYSVRTRKIFLSYASDDKAFAERIAFALRGRGYKVFLDKDDLPPGEDYSLRIEQAVAQSYIFIFLISSSAITAGRFTLTELEFARRKWQSAAGHVLPVMVEPTRFEEIPVYLTSVTVIEPKGNVAAEVAAAVTQLAGYKISLGRAVIRTLVLIAIAIGALYFWWNSDSVAGPGVRIFNIINKFQASSSDALNKLQQFWTSVSLKKIRSQQSFTCLDADLGTVGRNGTKVQLWGCVNQTNQTWEIHTDGTIVSPANNKCLDTEWGAIVQDGTRVILNDCMNIDSQRWVFHGDGAIVNAGSNKCLDADEGTIGRYGTKIQIWDCVNQSNQRWELSSAP
jgi:hypothetical protein